MKTPFLLFGLATACAAAPAKARYPLCDQAGAPACGNIGQVGRGEPTNAARPSPSPTSASVVTALHVVAEAPVRLVPIATRVLVGASQEVLRVGLTGQPLLDRNREVVCGNVMTKGGSHRVCRTPDGTIASATSTGAEEP